ncbi:hypothetical protein [Hydrogenimonas thermophila]|uniref:Uncharacterized protein n=1 Tax=Hydrogenimonas thermophila TaxID=223786 RepID=A0A1I5MPH9_9BACT|nr:hypothetical protein [Hydrogenimonas thermophila]WOE70968.1 hypothetical protein RZR91_05205 [Hydrogenimonas thermophila]WOE73486.1 hypothetical protein RZR97_05185 [Hydrogenimonas thermophila]SFP11197.1 hypothetical protein SAMN05216234_10679 [Hydrogenimonas thermophila]
MVRYFYALIFALSLNADILVVATNPKLGVDRLSEDTIASLYLDKRHTINGCRVVLLNLSFDSSLRRVFEEQVLKKSRQELERYWLRAHFRGHRPPKVVESEEAAALYIKKIPYAIGYMQKDIAKKYDLKIVYKLEF